MHLLHACYTGASFPLVMQIEKLLFLNAVHSPNNIVVLTETFVA